MSRMIDATTKPAHNFGEQQLEEIKKVFSVVDKDGNGTINSTELGTVIRSLAGSDPTPQELQLLMRRMDTNGDGVISWNEFVTSLSEWMAEADEEGQKSDTSRKRKATSSSLTPQKTRAKIHKKIQDFFLQYKRHDNFDEIRAKLAEQIRQQQSQQQLQQGWTIEQKQAYQQQLNQPMSSWIQQNESMYKEATPQEKLDALNKSSTLLPHLPHMALGISGNDPKLALKCTQGLADLLSICTVYQTPEERYEIADIMMTIFRLVSEAGVLKRVSDFLTCHNEPELQYEAARVLSYYAPGPRIAHTPRDSVMHPSRMLHKTALIQSGGLLSLTKLIVSPHMAVREQAVFGVGCMAAHDHEVRDLLLMMGVYEALIQQIIDSTPISLLIKITWVLSIFCGHTHSPEHPPPYEKIKQGLPKFAYLLTSSRDEKVLMNVFIALSHLLPGIVIEDGIAKQLVRYLSFPSTKVQSTALECLLCIIRVDSSASTSLIKSGLLVTLRELMKSTNDINIRLDACELITYIVQEQTYVGAVIESELIPALIQLIATDEMLRMKVIRIFKFMVRHGSASQVQYLVEKQDIVKILANSFSSFKNYDSVLRDVYHFIGASYNFDFIYDVVNTLDTILERSVEIPSITFVNLFDMECVDKMKSMMMTLASDHADQMDAWRNTSDTHTQQPLEEQLRTVLLKIKMLHQRVNSTMAPHMIQAIDETITTFIATYKKNQLLVHKRRKQKELEVKAQATTTTTSNGVVVPTGGAYPISLKCFFNNDNRVLEVNRDINLRELQLRIQLKYGRPLILQYEDDEGDRITIDSQEVLNRAMARFDVTRTYKLLLLESVQGRAGAASPLSMVSPRSGASPFSADAMSNASTSSQPWEIQRISYDAKDNLLNELTHVTQFSRQDLEKLYRQFQRTSSQGRLNKAQFAEGLRAVGQTDQVKIDQLFSAFDYDKDGYVDFRDFACGLSVMYKGTMDEKLDLAFKAYDLDGNGVIDKEELFQILKASFMAKGFYQSDQHVRALVEKSFEDADVDGNGTLDFEEFKQAVVRHQIVVQSFWKD